QPRPPARAGGTSILRPPLARDSSARKARMWLGSDVSSDVTRERCSPPFRCSFNACNSARSPPPWLSAVPGSATSSTSNSSFRPTKCEISSRLRRPVELDRQLARVVRRQGVQPERREQPRIELEHHRLDVADVVVAAPDTAAVRPFLQRAPACRERARAGCDDVERPLVTVVQVE